MTTKKLSVRMVAENGRQVRAELEGVGDAGDKAFGRIERRSSAASRAIATAMVAAAAAVVAMGTAMVRSGLQTISAQADIAESLNTTVASLQALHHAADLAGVATGEAEGGVRRLTRRLSLFVKDGGGPAAAAIRQLNLNAAELLALPIDQRLMKVNEALDQYATEAERAALLSQLFGDNSWMAFGRLDTETLRRATQDVHDFGVVVSEADAAQIGRVGEALSRLGLIWTGLANQLTVAVAPSIERAVSAMAAMAARTGPLGQAIQHVAGNLDRLATYAATFTAAMAGRWVAAFAAARVATLSLVGALTALRTALIRAGIGALVVIAGELIYQLTRLVSAVGGFGNAMRLLKDVAVEVFGRIKDAFGLIPLAVKAGAAQMNAWFIEKLIQMQNAFAEFTQTVAEGLNSLFGTDLRGARFSNPVTDPETWRALREAQSSAAATTEELAAAAASVVAPIESWEALAAAMAQADEDGAAALSDTAAAADEVAAAAGRAAGGAKEQADAAENLIDSLRRQLELERELDPVRRQMLGYTDQLTAATAAQRQRVLELVMALEETKTGWQAMVKSLADYAQSAASIGKDVGSVLVGAFQSAENAIGEFVKTGKLEFSDLINTMIADLMKLYYRQQILGPLADALGSALGSLGGGVRAEVGHSGGMAGSLPGSRVVPALAFAGAPRMHSGGMVGLRHDEVPAILQRGERVLSRSEVRNGWNAPPVIQLQPVLVNNTSRPVEMQVEEQTDARGQRQYHLVISDTVGDAVAVPGGKAARNLRQVYGLSRSARRRS